MLPLATYWFLSAIELASKGTRVMRVNAMTTQTIGPWAALQFMSAHTHTETQSAIQTISFCHRINNLIKWQTRHKRKIGECVVRGQAEAPSCASLRVDSFSFAYYVIAAASEKEAHAPQSAAPFICVSSVGFLFDYFFTLNSSGMAFYTNLFVGLHAQSDKNNQVFSLSVAC